MINDIKNLAKQYPNDQEFGKTVRDFLAIQANIPRNKKVKSSVEIIAEKTLPVQVTLKIKTTMSPEMTQQLHHHPEDLDFVLEAFERELLFLREELKKKYENEGGPL